MSLNKEISTYRSQEILIDKQLKSYESQIEKLKNSNSVLENDKKEHQTKLSNQMDEIKRLGEVVYEHENNQDQLNKQIINLTQANEKLQRSKSELDQQLQVMTDEVDDGHKVKQDLLSLTKQADRVNQEKNEIASQLDKASKDIEILQNHSKMQYDYSTKVKSELEKAIINLKQK